MVIFVRIVFTAIGALVGFSGSQMLARMNVMADFIPGSYLVGLFVIGGALLGLAAGLPLLKGIKITGGKVITALIKTPTSDLIGGIIGLVIGWIISLVISLPLMRIPIVGDYVPILLGLLLGSLGLIVGLRKKDDVLQGFTRSGQGSIKYNGNSQAIPKILDTSVIIDGRIADITKSGFLRAT